MICRTGRQITSPAIVEESIALVGGKRMGLAKLVNKATQAAEKAAAKAAAAILAKKK